MILSAINRIVSDQARRLQPASENHAVDRVCEYLRANLVSPGGLVTLGRIANLHPNYLLSVFVQHTGVTPQQFLDHLRVATAQELIRRGESLSMAAAAVGYSDQSHLTRNFRKLVGVTPGKYRTATSTQ